MAVEHKTEAELRLKRPRMVAMNVLEMLQKRKSVIALCAQVNILHINVAKVTIF